jgi:carbon monoxide dehydrogenase subunit G
MPGFVLRATLVSPPDAVFGALTDPANAPALFSGASPGTVVTPGPLRAGSRVRTSRTVAGRSFEGETTVDVHRPGKEFSLTASAQGVRVETRWRLAPDGAGTRVEYECRVQGSGLASLFEGAVVDALRRADADHLDRLRKLVDG